MLQECLSSLLRQTRPLDEVLVVNNASTDGTAQVLTSDFPQVRVLTLPENIGGSGGFHKGIQLAYDAGFDWVWVMDDDAQPHPDALSRLLMHQDDADVLVPFLQDQTGRLYGPTLWLGRNVTLDPKSVKGNTKVDLFPFVGPLIECKVVQRVGLPRKDFFILFDDHEYALRIKKAGLTTLLIPKSIIYHNPAGGRRQASFLGKEVWRKPLQPAWKSYYSTRNYLYAVTRSVPGLKNIGWYVVVQLRRLCVDLVFERDRWTRTRYRLLGFLDGLLGRMGKRV
jgi:GT2 family glycosyltransferase